MEINFFPEPVQRVFHLVSVQSDRTYPHYYHKAATKLIGSDRTEPNPTIRILAQLRTNKWSTLHSYLNIIDEDKHPSPLCPLFNYTTTHISRSRICGGGEPANRPLPFSRWPRMPTEWGHTIIVEGVCSTTITTQLMFLLMALLINNPVLYVSSRPQRPPPLSPLTTLVSTLK